MKKISDNLNNIKEIFNKSNTINNEMNIINNVDLNNIDNNNKIRKTRIHIDSSYRNKIPKNILNNIKYLNNNPLYFIKNSSEIIIYCKDHNYQQDDRIVINNVKGKEYNLTNGLLISINDQYIKIYHENHNIIDYLSSQLYSDIYITISGVIGNKKNGTFYNNIPINIINKKHLIYIKKEDSKYNNNYYYIKIPIIPDFTDTYNDIINIYFHNINSIPTSSINANFPITVDNINGYHIINNIYNNNFFSINVDFFSINNSNSNLINYINNNDYNNIINDGLGGDNINIAKIIDYIEGYPYNNNYKINLNKNFYNVYRIDLVSSEIPNTEKTIKNYPIEKQNNLLYWQILDDGDHIYKIELTPGYYNINTLTDELMKQINNTLRINSNLIDTIKSIDNYYEITKYHRSTVIIDYKSSIITISMFNEISVDYAVEIIEISSINKYTKLKIIHPNHGLNIGDIIYLSNILSFNKIPNSVLNTSFKIVSIIDSSNYIVNLPNYSNNGSLTLITSGTANLIRYPIRFRLLFNKQGTIGNLLGFKNIGNINSITPYNFSITNIDKYENYTNYDSIGNIINNDYDININLNGDNYILLSIPLFKNSINVGNISNLFAKLFLIGPPNTVIYDSYVQISNYLPIKESSLNELELYFYDKNGYLYNFNNIEHSLTFEIYEQLL